MNMKKGDLLRMTAQRGERIRPPFYYVCSRFINSRRILCRSKD